METLFQLYSSIFKIIETLGILSAKSQGLKQVITSTIRFFGSDHRIYIKVKDEKALGFVKVGEKTLFYRDYVNFLYNTVRKYQIIKTHLCA